MVEEHIHEWSLWQQRYNDSARADGIYRIFWYERICFICHAIETSNYSTVKIG